MQNTVMIITLLLSAQVMAQSTDQHFSHTLATTATPASIWRIWTDVPNWKTWDDGLKDARLNGPFQNGTKGQLIPDKGPKSTFTLVEVDPGQSYTFRTRLPLGALYVKRSLKQSNGQTQFTHEVWFTGLTKGLFSRSLGRNYRAILPKVMTKLKMLAES